MREETIAQANGNRHESTTLGIESTSKRTDSPTSAQEEVFRPSEIVDLLADVADAVACASTECAALSYLAEAEGIDDGHTLRRMRDLLEEQVETVRGVMDRFVK